MSKHRIKSNIMKAPEMSYPALIAVYPSLPPPRTSRGRRRGGLFAAALLALLPAFSSFSAPPAGMSQNAVDELTALIQEKASWTPAQQKLDSVLIHALKKSRGQPFAPRAKNLRLGMSVPPDNRVLVDITAKVTPELIALINRNGTVTDSFPQSRAVRAFVNLNHLETLAENPDVASIQRAAQAFVNTGTVDSEGDTTHLAAAARAAFGATGLGVKVGVLSDSDDYIMPAQTSGDLGVVTVLPGQSGQPGSGEGTAMMEIVADLAPDAQLYFATAFHGVAGFSNNILALRSAGCDIIIDDVGYFNESPFQDGPIAQAVNTVTAGGALYFSSAGNSGNLDAGTSGTWEGDFVDGGPISFPEVGNIHSFGATTYNTVATGGSSRHVDLFWADPLGAANNDYDVFVLDSTGSQILDSSMTRQNGFQDPYEYVATLAVGERIVIVKYSGDARFLHLGTGRGRLAISTSGTTLGHSATTNAFSVAAVSVYTASPSPGVFTAFTGGSANPVETFSSDGPRHVFYQQDGSPITPGNFSSTGGAIRQKPDIAAADGVSTTLPSTSGLNPFYGTSAAAPHAGAIAALMLSYNHSLTPAQVRSILTSTALDIGPPGVDRDSGAGIVMAYQALTNLALATPPGIVNQPASQTLPVGSTATFTVSAVGAMPLSYFWKRNGAPISGANSSTYSTNNVQLSDSGAQFSCLITNSAGSATSSVATLTVVAAPSNDQCSGATNISSAPYANSQSTANATSTGDPIPCASLLKGVWYQYSPPSGGQIVVDTTGSDFDTVLGLYSGSCSSLSLLACNDDNGALSTSIISNSVSAGTTYFMLAGGFQGATGNLAFHLTFTATATAPIIVSNGLGLVTETCPNGAVDPGETVTMSFSLKNVGNAATTNLVVTLLSSGGVSSPSGAQTYGALAAGTSLDRPFTFTAIGLCGQTNFATLQLQDGAANLGTITFNIILGQTGNTFAEYFDTVTPPALPAGWTTSASGAGVPWVSTNGYQDSPPNSVFAPSTATAGVSDLISPPIAVRAAGAQLTFRHYYDMEDGYDGGVLDIKVGSADFTNILDAGGSYLTNGPDTVLPDSLGNPLGGQLAWSGNSSFFITTIVQLPPAAAGQNIQLRWRCGSDMDTKYVGWAVDSITLSAPGCCVNLPSITAQPQNQTSPVDGSAAFSVAASGSAPISFQWRLNGINLTGATGSSLSLTNLQFTNAGLYTVVVSNFAGVVTSSVAVFNVAPRLYSQMSASDLRLTWPGPFILQAATNLSGPYLDLLAANSPYPYHVTNGPQRFFRLRSQPFSLSASNLAAGQFQATGAGVPGANFVIQASADLTTWINLQTNPSPFMLLETNTWQYPRRFYRAVLAH